MSSYNTFSTLNAGKQAQIIYDLMDLFKSNTRGYGVGEFEGAKFEEEKGKWKTGHTRWSWGVTTREHWHDHLSGKILLGQGVLCDDNRCWYGSLDVDKYEIDYNEEMRKIRNSKLPLVVCRTKSGGLRVLVFFSEPIEADQVLSRMRRVASILGYAGCEIFPKQTALIVEKNDCPSWIFMPFGGTHDMFPEQGCMTDNGNLMELPDAIEHMKSMRISKAQFLEMFTAEEAAKTNGKTNGKKHPKGAWIEEEGYETNINTMFWDGPPCMWIITHRKCHDMKNNFLFSVCRFLKRKYPENWEKAIEWVNYNVLVPAGDRDKLSEIIKGHKQHEYEYRCHDEPICSFCDPHACRRKPYGVGNNGGIDHYELGLTEVLRVPRIYFANVGDTGETRMMLESEDLQNQARYQKRCIDYGIPAPVTRKKEEWETFIRKAMESATKVEPSSIMRTNAFEIEILSRWFSILVPTYMRVGDKPKDKLRVDMDEKRVYFKWQGLKDYCMSMTSDANLERVRRFVDSECENHGSEGYRDWKRYTRSISFDKLDREQLEEWLNPEP